MKRRALGDSQLHGYQVDAGDFFGHRVLHLDPRVDLEEDELLTGHQELDRGDSTVIGLRAQPSRCPVQLTTQCWRNTLCRCDFDQLLVAALNAAVPVAQRERARRRCDDLHLDMPRVGQMRLGKQRRIAEAELRFCGALPVGVVNLVGAVDYSHAATAAAGKRFDHDRAIVGGGEGADVVDAAGSVGGRQHRHTGRCRRAPGRRLVAEQFERGGVGPDERVSRGRTRLRETGLFAEEPVTGMDQLGAGVLGRRQDRCVVEVCGRAGAGQSDRFVGRVHVRAVGIVLGVDGDRVELQLGCRADDSERDLTAVSDQQARHVRSFLRSTPVGFSVDPDPIMPLPRLPDYWPPDRRRTSSFIAGGDVKEKGHEALHLRGIGGCAGRRRAGWLGAAGHRGLPVRRTLRQPMRWTRPARRHLATVRDIQFVQRRLRVPVAEQALRSDGT